MQPNDLGERSIVTGTRQQMIDQLKRVEECGIEELICHFSFSAYPHEQVLHQVERFAAEAMTAFA